MPRTVTYNWPAANSTDIVSGNALTAAGFLPINGLLANVGVVNFDKISRTVSLTSTANLSARSFTISGYLNGFPVSETRTGPNNTTVTTTQVFSSIVSVYVNGAMAGNVSIGSGNTGFTDWFEFNTFVQIASLSVNVIEIANPIQAYFECTFDDVRQTSDSGLNFIYPLSNIDPATDTQFGNLTYPVAFARIRLGSSTGNAGVMKATFLQQGMI